MHHKPVWPAVLLRVETRRASKSTLSRRKATCSSSCCCLQAGSQIGCLCKETRAEGAPRFVMMHAPDCSLQSAHCCTPIPDSMPCMGHLL